MSDDLPPPVDPVDELFEEMHRCKECKNSEDGICPSHDGALYMMECP